MADEGRGRGGFGRGFGDRGRGDRGRGDRGRGDRGRGRGGRRGRKDEEEKWVPCTKLGRLVQQVIARREGVRWPAAVEAAADHSQGSGGASREPAMQARRINCSNSNLCASHDGMI